MLELYQAEGCPHSAEVRETLTDLGVSYVIHNPRRPGNEGGDVLNKLTQQAMVDIGGEDAIPLLVDTDRGETLSESEEIIDYLETHYE
ncbi:glutathione S-transferase N-terminal domain-containing protein [Haloterrigena salifodinae]|uniref:Glutathione S-transferase N-terminal domain-containing protein n=1 Tax=Haloterrigena salifodinae TaxID=2675099 RepID=A0A8T8DVY5_9EURY|nr:glutathione S-transferase N-terminal domain-containing protein [Haloterrigena salifodinae]QRV13728.1 glutathione S-transferase N-terminal domain-containing protein [Haloterrigena salifodinae]